ncbi:cache domain-containing protein [Bacillus coahuilensis]|uniref:cache domain-containing protein n=1 Tax=Bacillus coahuilensis TaxID=408580 RepID=UPI0004945A95|nr:cache domain-containing protein [Bacillus coahuilensis]
MKLRRNPFQVSSKSLLVKMLSSILSIVLVSLLVLSTISIYVSYSIISSDSKTWLETELGETMDGIEKEFIGHQRIAESISQIVGVNGTDMSTSQYQNLLERMAVINESTLGTGVWFEPYAYQSETQYFGPYVYKDGNSTTFTEEYATADYDYPNQDWYVNGKGAMNWSTPYFDEATGITMITTAAPITNDRNEFMGVVSADIDLSTVQEQINNVQIKRIWLCYII